MGDRPLTTTLVVGGILWALYLWRGHKLTGAAAPSSPSGTSPPGGKVPDVLDQRDGPTGDDGEEPIPDVLDPREGPFGLTLGAVRRLFGGPIL